MAGNAVADVGPAAGVDADAAADGAAAEGEMKDHDGCAIDDDIGAFIAVNTGDGEDDANDNGVGGGGEYEGFDEADGVGVGVAFVSDDRAEERGASRGEGEPLGEETLRNERGSGG